MYDPELKKIEYMKNREERIKKQMIIYYRRRNDYKEYFRTYNKYYYQKNKEAIDLRNRLRQQNMRVYKKTVYKPSYKEPHNSPISDNLILCFN